MIKAHVIRSESRKDDDYEVAASDQIEKRFSQIITPERVAMKYKNKWDNYERLPIRLAYVAGTLKQGIVEALGRNIEVDSEVNRIAREKKIERETGYKVWPRQARFIPAAAGIYKIPYVAPFEQPFYR